MGYTRHHTIVVTGLIAPVNIAHEEAVKIFGDAVSSVVGPATNGYFSFFVAPDGSKEGWSESDEGDERRAKFREYLSHPDCWCSWVEVQFADDYGENLILYSR